MKHDQQILNTWLSFKKEREVLSQNNEKAGPGTAQVLSFN